MRSTISNFLRRKEEENRRATETIARQAADQRAANRAPAPSTRNQITSAVNSGGLQAWNTQKPKVEGGLQFHQPSPQSTQNYQNWQKQTGNVRNERTQQLQQEVQGQNAWNSFTSRLRSRLGDANRPEDRLSRVQHGQPELYADQQRQHIRQGVQTGEISPLDAPYRHIGNNPAQRAWNIGRTAIPVMGEGPRQLGHGVGEQWNRQHGIRPTEQWQEATRAQDIARQNVQEAFSQTIAELNNPALTPQRRAELEQYLQVLQQIDQDVGTGIQKQNDLTEFYSDPRRAVAAGVDAALTAIPITFGAKAIANPTVRNATIGAVSSFPIGAANPTIHYGSDATLQDSLLAGGVAAGAGAGLPLLLGGIGKLPAKYISTRDNNIARTLSERSGQKVTADDVANARFLSSETGNPVTPTQVAQAQQIRRAQEALSNAKENQPKKDLKVTSRDPVDVGTPRKPGEVVGRVEPDFVVSVVRRDGTTQQYRPKSPEEAASFKQRIDDARRANGQADDGVAGVRDKNGDIWHISSGENVKADYSPMTKTPELKFSQAKPPAQPATIKPGQAQPIGELIPNEGRFTQQSPNKILQDKYPQFNQSTIANLYNRHGLDGANNLLARYSDAAPNTPGKPNDINRLVMADSNKMRAETRSTKIAEMKPQQRSILRDEIIKEQQRARLTKDEAIVQRLREKYRNDPERYLKALKILNDGTPEAKKTNVAQYQEAPQPAKKEVPDNVDPKTGEIIEPTSRLKGVQTQEFMDKLAKADGTERINKAVRVASEGYDGTPKVRTGDQKIDNLIKTIKETTPLAKAVDRMPEPRKVTQSIAKQIQRKAGKAVTDIYKNIETNLKQKGYTLEQFIDIVEGLVKKDGQWDLTPIKKAGLDVEFAAHRGTIEKLNELNPHINLDERLGLMYFPRQATDVHKAGQSAVDILISEFPQAKHRTGTLVDYAKTPEALGTFAESTVARRFQNVASKPKSKMLQSRYGGEHKSYKPTDNPKTLDNKTVSSEFKGKYSQETVEALRKEELEMKPSEYGKDPNLSDNLTTAIEKMGSNKQDVPVNKLEDLSHRIREGVGDYGVAKNEYGKAVNQLFRDNKLRKTRKVRKQITELLSLRDQAGSKEGSARKKYIADNNVPDNVVKTADGLMDIALEVRDALRYSRLNNNKKMDFKTNFSKDDGLFNVEQFIDAGLREIHMGYAISALDGLAAKFSADGHGAKAEWIQGFRDAAFYNKPTRLDQLTGFGNKTKTIVDDDGSKFKVVTDESTKLRKGAQTLTRWRSEAALTLNPNFILGTMPSSLAIVPKEVGLRNTADGFLKAMYDERLRDLAFNNPEARIKRHNTVTRTGMADADVQGLSTNKIKKGMQIPTQMMENKLQQMALTAGYADAHRMGLNARQADIYAAKVARRTQSTYDSFNRTAMQNSVIFRAAAPFQTFYFEMNRQFQQLIGVGGGNELSRAARFQAAMNLTAGLFIMNELYRTWNDQYISGPGIFMPVFGDQMNQWISDQRINAMAYLDENTTWGDLPIVGGRLEQATRDKDTREFFAERNQKLEERLKEISLAMNGANDDEKAELKREQDEIKETLKRSRRQRFPIAPGEDFRNLSNAVMSFTRGNSRPLQDQITFWTLGRFGGPGAQTNRMRRGIEATVQGEQKTASGNTAFPVEGFLDSTMSIIRGPYASKPGREYLQGTRQAMSADASEKWRSLSGGDKLEFYEETQELYKNLNKLGKYEDKRRASLDKDANDKYDSIEWSFDGDYDDWDQEAERQAKALKHRWATINSDFSIWEARRDIMAEKSRVLGNSIDPMFELNDNQAKDYIRLMATGHSNPGGNEYRELLDKSNFLSDFMRERAEHFDKLAKEGVFDDYDGGNIVRPPEKDARLEKLLENYNSMEEASDRGKYIRDNPEIGEFFNDMAEYTNLRRKLLGLPELKTRPQASESVLKLQDQYFNLPRGTGARTRFMRDNPTLQTYWDEVNEFNLIKDATKAQFKGNEFDEDSYENIARVARSWERRSGRGGGNREWRKPLPRVSGRIPSGRVRIRRAKPKANIGKSGAKTVKIQRGIKPKTIKMKRA